MGCHACGKYCRLCLPVALLYEKSVLTKQENNRAEKQICSSVSSRLLVGKVAGQVC